jgi:hypothetical protein
MTQMAPTEIDLEQLARSESEGLIAHLVTQRARLSQMAAQALEAELPGVAVRCENAMLANLTLVSQLLGQLVHRSETITRSFLVEPDYLAFRQILIEELRGHPELAARIASRIAEIETKAANAIKVNPPKTPLMINAPPVEAGQ